jgi:hypothetical protein
VQSKNWRGGGSSLAKEKSFYDLSKTQTLDNKQLAEWLRDIEDRLKKA